ncbi:MAG TPA: hypothetical protein GX695_05110 [Acholeplasmataceae bacterium]|nr:hypothetical protein [Acholeplasmataceae bacterium]
MKNKNEVGLIELMKNSYVIRTSKGDYRLDIYTDGIVVEKGFYLDAGKHGYIWETKGHLFYEDDRKIKRRTQKIANEIIKEVTTMLIEGE